MIKIELKAKELQQTLNDLYKKSQNLQPLMAQIAQTLYTITDESFDNQASPAGVPWQPLSPSTQKNKKTNKILFESGNLRGSLTAFGTHNQAIVGVNATYKSFPYGLTHQFGSTKLNIPARPFLPVDENYQLYSGVIEDILALVEDYFKD